MKDRAPAQWEGEARRTLGIALLRAKSESMTASELGRATGKDPSNLRRFAERLVQEGLLQRREPVAAGGHRGRPSATAFGLADGEAERLEAALREDGEARRLNPSQQLVFVEAGAQMDNLLDVLAEEEVMARAAWAGLCDGSRQELLIAFDGSGAVDASLDLMAILSAAGLRATRATVSKVESASDLVKAARRRQELIRRRRARRERPQAPGRRR